MSSHKKEKSHKMPSTWWPSLSVNIKSTSLHFMYVSNKIEISSQFFHNVPYTVS